MNTTYGPVLGGDRTTTTTDSVVSNKHIVHSPSTQLELELRISLNILSINTVYNILSIFCWELNIIQTNITSLMY